MELEDGLLPKEGRTKETGTCVNFLPDPEIFEVTRFSAAEVKSRMHETAYLNPKLTIDFAESAGEEPEYISFHEPDGIIGFVKDLNKKRKRFTIRFILPASRKGSPWNVLSSM